MSYVPWHIAVSAESSGRLQLRHEADAAHVHAENRHAAQGRRVRRAQDRAVPADYDGDVRAGKRGGLRLCVKRRPHALRAVLGGGAVTRTPQARKSSAQESASAAQPGRRDTYKTACVNGMASHPFPVGRALRVQLAVPEIEEDVRPHHQEVQDIKTNT